MATLRRRCTRSIWSLQSDLRIVIMDRYVAAADFKANCLRLMDGVAWPGCSESAVGAVDDRSGIRAGSVDRALVATGRSRGVVASRDIPSRPGRSADRCHRARDERYTHDP